MLLRCWLLSARTAPQNLLDGSRRLPQINSAAYPGASAPESKTRGSLPLQLTLMLQRQRRARIMQREQVSKMQALPWWICMRVAVP